MSDCLDAALDLIRRGARIFPLHGVQSNGGRFVCTCGTPDCDNAGKHPLARLAPRGVKMSGDTTNCPPDDMRN